MTMNFREQKIILGYKMICLSLLLFITELSLLPLYASFYIEFHHATVSWGSYLGYLSVQPAPIILLCTGCITVLGIVLVFSGRLKKPKPQTPNTKYKFKI